MKIFQWTFICFFALFLLYNKQLRNSIIWMFLEKGIWHFLIYYVYAWAFLNIYDKICITVSYVLRQIYLYDKTHGEFHHNDSLNICSIYPISVQQTLLSINISLGYYENSHSIYMSRMIIWYTCTIWTCCSAQRIYFWYLDIWNMKTHIEQGLHCNKWKSVSRQ